MKPSCLRLRRADRRLPAGAAALLVLALLWAQALGLAHRIAHAPVAASHASAAQDRIDDAARPSTFAAEATGAATHGHGVLDHAPQGADCRLLDQLVLGDAVEIAAGDAVALPPPIVLVGARPSVSVAASVTAYRARAPPVNA